MSKTDIKTQSLFLVLESLDDCRAKVAAMSIADQAELSADWLEFLNGATSADPWIVGFDMVRREDQALIGQCGFKGPPSADGCVEIAYGVQPAEQGNGYATEAAKALTHFALQSDDVQLVRAHTLPTHNASTRVLTKCGFHYVGVVHDPDDGLVWRWEISGKTS